VLKVTATKTKTILGFCSNKMCCISKHNTHSISLKIGYYIWILSFFILLVGSFLGYKKIKLLKRMREYGLSIWIVWHAAAVRKDDWTTDKRADDGV